MDNQTIKTMLTTETKDYDEVAKRLAALGRPMHGAIGLCTESAELLDALKKHIYYGKEVDVVNIEEELGDLMFYLGILIEHYGLDIDQIVAKNIEKLRARYPNKFSESSAIHRNLEKERAILEQTFKGKKTDKH